MTKFLSFVLLSGLIASPAFAKSEREQTACLNRCLSYKVFCHTEVLRQIEQASSSPENCLTPEQLEFNLKQCPAAAKQCEDSCFGDNPAATAPNR